MKKKIVAFAVTAAMLVTSAIPVFAVGGWGETAAPANENPNVVSVTSSGITTDDMAGTVDSGVDFQTVVDLNTCDGYAQNHNMTLTLNYNGSRTQVLTLTKTNYTSSGAAQYAASFGGQTINGLSGICDFDWSIDSEGVTVTVYQYGKQSTSVGTMTADVPASATQVNSLTAKASANTYTMYVEYPENVQSVQVVDAEGEAVTQPEAGGTYTIESITLDHDTVISSNITEYVSIQWNATKNGKATQIGTGLTCTIPDNDTTRGAVISVTVTANGGTGVFGDASWGTNSNALAVAERIFGADRYQTSLAVAEEIRNGGNLSAVVVANGDSFADALSGTALADATDAPILLVNQYNEDAVIDYINKHLEYSDKVYILGGTGAVSAGFESAVSRYDVERLGGSDRYATNIEILKEIATVDESRMENIAVCYGLNYPDALSVSATGMPVLLVGSSITDAQDEYLKSINGINDKYYIIGGTGVISSSIERAMRTLDYVGGPEADDPDTDIVRLGGSDRYQTNKLIVDMFFTAGSYENSYIASGNEFPDALTGGALAAHNDSPLLLVNNYNTQIAGEIVGDKSSDMVVIGGTGAVSAAAVQAIYNAAHAA